MSIYHRASRHSRWLVHVAGLTLLGIALFVFCSRVPAGLSAGETPPKAGDVRKNTKDGAEMVWVPEGEFLMGTTEAQIKAILMERNDYKAEWFIDEKPQHKVKLSGYWIYKYEVTVAQYRKFCQDTRRKMPAIPKWASDNFPIVNVTWYDADAYAEWAGGHLPTEAEWEKAARGTDGRRFPWGNVWNQDLCNNFSDHGEAGGGLKGNRTAPVGSYPKSVSPYGAQDMSGNVWEWCQDWYDAEYYEKSPAENPEGPKDGEARVLRGGSWGSTSKSTSTTVRNSEQPELTYHDDGGFRCVVPGKIVKENKE